MKILPIVTLMVMTLCFCSSSSSKPDPDPVINPFGTDAKFEPPQFIGTFEVGTRVYFFEDTARPEPHLSGGNREVGLRMFFPTENATTSQMPVMPDLLWDHHASQLELNDKQLRQSNFTSVTWPIWEEAIPKPGPWPLIVFSHGYGLSPEGHSYLAANLASLGFVVASINHAFGSTYLEKPNGQVILPHDYHGNDEARDLWSFDQSFILDQIQIWNMNPDSLWYDHFDENIVAMGHSFGGTTSYFTSLRDDRFKLAIDLDGGFAETEVDIPFLYIEGGNNQLRVLDLCSAASFHVEVIGIHHISFADDPLWFEWDHSSLNYFGTTQPERAYELIVGTVQQFLELHLSGTPAPWFSGDESTPSELRFTASP